MKKKWIFFIIILLATVLSGFYLYYNNKNNDKIESFNAITNSSIIIPKDGHIYFFTNGFAVASPKNTLFYNFAGQKIDAPLPKNDMELLGGAPIITHATNRYMLFQDKYLYDTTKLPFNKILELPGKIGWGLKEFSDSLLIILKNDKGILEPWIISNGSSSLNKLDIMPHLNFLDADYNDLSKEMSVLCVNTQNPFPTSNILHFNNKDQPYGLLSFDDQLFYRIYRLKKANILFSLHQVCCYDIDSKNIWSIKIPSCYDHQMININDALGFYYNDIYIDKQNNTLLVNQDAKYSFMAFPPGLTSLKNYKKGFIAVKGGKNIVLLDSKGSIVFSKDFNSNIQDIYWTRYNPNYIYILYKTNELKIFSTLPKEKDDNK